MSVNYSAGLSPYVNKGKCGMIEKFDTSEQIDESVEKLVTYLKESKYTVVHSGAGISTAAGIPDFRGPNGVWTLEQKGKTPDCNITFEDAVPTFSHFALKELEKRNLVHHVVSQNIDGLHVRSGFPKEKLSELHGNMFTRKCNTCLKEVVKDTVSPTMALNYTGEKCNGNNSRGGKCRGKLKDTILDWEDSLPDHHLTSAETACKKSQLSITLGTSLQILPAANLPLLTKKNNGKLVIINLQPTKHDKKADLRIYGYIDNIMRKVMEAIDIKVVRENDRNGNKNTNSEDKVNMPTKHKIEQTTNHVISKKVKQECSSN